MTRFCLLAFALAPAMAAVNITTATLPNATVGAPYLQALSASGGPKPYTWTLASGSLPSGLSLSAAGTIAGVPASAGTATFIVQVADAGSATDKQSLRLAVYDPLVIPSTAFSIGLAGTPYSQTLSATGGSGGNVWSLASGSLPPGLALSRAGVVSGTPSAPGSSAFTVQVQDSSGSVARLAGAITIGAATLAVSTSSLPNGTVGAPYAQFLSATGGAGGYSWTVVFGSLPAGLNLAPSGMISGTPSAAGPAAFTVQAMDSGGSTTTRSLGITIDAPPLAITTTSLPNGTVGAAYSQTLFASGGAGGYTWSVIAGSLPPGLSLTSNAIAGTPSSAGSFPFIVQVKDSSGATASQALAVTINPPPLTIATTSLPNGTVGTGYSQSLSASGGTGGYTWSVIAGSLPPGLSLNSNAIGGTPSSNNTFHFTVQVKDSSGATASQALTVTINPPALTIATTSLPNGTVGTAYSQTLSASGGTGGYAWSVTGGSLPPGLSLNSKAIAGTPSSANTFNFTVQVKDSSGATATQALAVTINPPALTITTTSLPSGTVGTAYSQTLSASGGTGGYAWSLTGGSLPPGLSLTSNAIGGTPSSANTFHFTVQVKDSSGATATQALAVIINPPALTITTTSLPNGSVGTAYSQTLSASGGTGGYAWSVTAGSLPQGLSLNSNAIAGTPSSANTFNFTVQVKDSSGATATQALAVTINPPALTITTTSLPSGTVGTAYSQSLSASGGTGGYAWSVTAGSLASGLSLSSGGVLSGTPTAFGSSSFTAQVKDSAGATATQALSFTVNPAALRITTTSLPSGEVGLTYSQSLAASGGAGGYSWSVVSGTLPAGLALGPGGAISGSPSAAGNAGFTVQVKDSNSATATTELSIAIAAPPAITTAALPGAVAETPYSQALSAAGGAGGYRWSVSGGSPPPGLSLSPTGTLAGTPGSPGIYSFTVRITDAASVSATRDFTIAVASPVNLNTATLPDAEKGGNYFASLTASGGSGPYSWSVTAGQLPGGLSLNAATGVISGIPNGAGSFAFTIAASDIAGLGASGDFSITVRPPVAITTGTTLAGASAGSPYSQTLAASGGFPPYSWSLVSGALPTGLIFDLSTGTVSGTPSQVGTFQLTLQATDSDSVSSRNSFTLTVVSGLTIATAPVLPPATSGVRYTVVLQPAGGKAPYVWTVTTGALPGGLTFDATGQIDGTPTGAGTFQFTAQVTDGNSNKASKDFTLSVAGALVITTAPGLPPGNAGAAYQQALSASGGTAPYVWSITSGSLPPGVTLQPSSGALIGTPTAAGSFAFTATVTDAANVTVQKQFTVTIAPGVTFTTPASLPNATVGASYSFTLGASGGKPPYSWSITQGALPAGMALNASSGVISGTPSAPGTDNFTVQVTDSDKLSASRVHTIVVALPSSAPALSINGVGATAAPLQQPAVDITVSSPYPTAISGRINVGFAPGGANPADDPSIQFSTGGRSAAFTIPANATHATFSAPQFAVQVGSVTGNLTFTIDSVQAAGTALPAPGPVVVHVDAGPPSIRSATVTRTGGGFQLQVVAVSSTREITQATVNFHPSAGSNIQTATVNVPLMDVAKTWFQSGDSSAYGGQFTLTIPFTFSGVTGSLDSVSIILTNGVGNSQEVSAAY